MPSKVVETPKYSPDTSDISDAEGDTPGMQNEATSSTSTTTVKAVSSNGGVNNFTRFKVPRTDETMDKFGKKRFVFFLYMFLNIVFKFIVILCNVSTNIRSLKLDLFL